MRTNLDVLAVQQNVYSTRRDLAQALFNYLIGFAAAQGGGRLADRRRPRGAQPPAARLTSGGSQGSASRCARAPRRSAARATRHSRSAAPRCAAWKASAASPHRRPARCVRRAGGPLRRPARRHPRRSMRGARVERVGRRLGEVEHVRADERRPADGDRLDQVLAAERQQAAADEGDVGGRVVRHHLAHRVAEHDADVGGHRRSALRRTNAMPRSRSRSATAVEALRMPRHDDGQRARRQRRRARARRGSAPPRRRGSSRRSRPGARAEARAQLPPQRERGLARRDVELEVAGDERRASRPARRGARRRPAPAQRRRRAPPASRARAIAPARSRAAERSDSRALTR